MNEPVTLGDLRVSCETCGRTGQVEHYVSREAAIDAGYGPEWFDSSQPDQCMTCSSMGVRPATLADLVSALRAEGKAVPAWVGDSSVDEVQDLVWDDHADVIDVRQMNPVWVLPRVLGALAEGQP